jgi:hypothetical protein
MVLSARITALAKAIGADIKAIFTKIDANVGRVPTVATYADLPASVVAATLYVVTADANNQNETSLYVLLGTQKIWIASEPVL